MLKKYYRVRWHRNRIVYFDWNDSIEARLRGRFSSLCLVGDLGSGCETDDRISVAEAENPVRIETDRVLTSVLTVAYTWVLFMFVWGMHFSARKTWCAFVHENFLWNQNSCFPLCTKLSSALQVILLREFLNFKNRYFFGSEMQAWRPPSKFVYMFSCLP